MWFSRKELPELRDQLAKLLPLQVVQIRQPEQILLDSRLRTTDGYSISTKALQQFCYRLSPGLAFLIDGLLREHTAMRRHVGASPEAAARIFNEVVRCRFEAVRNRYLLRDTAENMIVGNAGRRPLIRPSEQFLDMCLEHSGDWIFCGAELVERELTLRFGGHSFAVQTPDSGQHTYRVGVVLCSRESNRCYLRAANAVIRGNTVAAACLEPYLPRGVSTSLDSDDIVSQAVAKRLAEAATVTSRSLVGGFDRLTQDLLFSEVNSAAKYKTRARQLQEQLRMRMTSDTASLVLTRVLKSPAVEMQSPYLQGLAVTSPTVWPYVQLRRWYHLFEALLYVQQHPQCTSDSRWAVGRVAYAVLTGKRKLNFRKDKDKSRP